MILAQISDFHLTAKGQIRGGIDSMRALDAALAALSRLDPLPDAVVASGDLVNRGDPGDYLVLREKLAGLPFPLYLAPGNHDARDPLRRVFGGSALLPTTGPFLHYAVALGPWRLIVLDTAIGGEAVGGRLCAERLDWLAETLAEASDRPTVIALHHPPFKVGVVFMDRPPFEGAEALGALLLRNPQVKKLLCGHLHRHVETTWAGTMASVAPSLVFQMTFTADPTAASSYILEPPGFLVHLLEDNGRVVTHACPLGDFGPARPFHPPKAV